MTFIKIDAGKHTTKAEYNGVRISFDSKMDKGIAQFGSDTVVFDNTSYIVGEEANSYDLALSKNTFQHKVLIYTAIGKLIKNESKIDIAIGIPLTLYFNEVEKEEYIKNISNNNQPINIEINGERKYFIIDNVIVCPEALGGSLNDFSNSKKIIRGAIDLGGLNANGIIYDKGRPVRNSLFTLNKGTHILESELQTEITSKTGRLLENYVLKDYLVRGCKDPVIQNIIDEHCIKFIKDIERECLKKNWNLFDIEIYLMGGGSILLEKYLDARFKTPVFARDTFANVEAFGIFGEKKLAKK